MIWGSSQELHSPYIGARFEQPDALQLNGMTNFEMKLCMRKNGWRSFVRGGIDLKPQKVENIFLAVITFPPFFCADTFNTSLLLIVCALK